MKFIYGSADGHRQSGHASSLVEDASRRGVEEVSPTSMRALLSVDSSQRDVLWLRQMLQYAIELEFDTIPPYLFAMWSIEDLSSPASLFISQIVRQEMLHMGIACNLLNAIGGKPLILSPHILEPYPKQLPGGVHPGLTLDLLPISKSVVCHVFMEIEKPESGPITFFRGETYPTIGSFYSAIREGFESLSHKEVTGERQITLRRPGMELKAIKTIADAIAVIELIAEQGEGTAASPLYGPNPDDKAHYYLFGEMYHERLLVEDARGNWGYTGQEIKFPTDIYPVAAIPAAGYPESDAFNEKFSEMLRELESAWELGGDAGGTHLLKSFDLMTEMSPLATTLMQQTGPSGGNLAPTFRYT